MNCICLNPGIHGVVTYRRSWCCCFCFDMTNLQYVACVWSTGSNKEGVLYVFTTSGITRLYLLSCQQEVLHVYPNTIMGPTGGILVILVILVQFST